MILSALLLRVEAVKAVAAMAEIGNAGRDVHVSFGTNTWICNGDARELPSRGIEVSKWKTSEVEELRL